jgi:hypothetical protein
MNPHTAADRMLLALNTLANADGRLCEVPLRLLADVAGVAVSDARWGLRRLDDIGRVRLCDVPTDADRTCRVWLLPPWPEKRT